MATFSKVLNKVLNYLLIVFIILSVYFGYTTFRYYNLNKVNKQNTAYLLSSNSYWKTATGKYVATVVQQTYTVKQLRNSTNKTINELRDTNKEIGIKLRKTEYLLNAALGLRIDTTVIVNTDTINNTKIVHIDKLQIGSFKLTRIQEVNSDSAHYDIEYRPKVTVSINWYKEGKWKLRNIFDWREKIYKADVIANDGIMKPEDVTLIHIK